MVQQAAESFAAGEGRVVVSRRRQRCEQFAVDALMVALEVVVLDEFSDGALKMSLNEQHFVQALALDRQHEPLGVRVQVRTVRRQLDVFDARAAEYLAELMREERIAIVDVPAGSIALTWNAADAIIQVGRCSGCCAAK
jgi:hypothetical protein